MIKKDYAPGLKWPEPYRSNEKYGIKDFLISVAIILSLVVVLILFDFSEGWF